MKGTYMTDNSESQTEAASMTKEALNTAKTRVRLGFWNVRTMYDTGKLAQVVAEMKRYKLHILGISESRWTGSGKIKTTSGEIVLYSGREDNLHYEGVSIILKKGVDKSLLEWKPISSRLIKIRLKGKQVNTTIFQCYAPTNDKNEEEKDQFYQQLQAELESTPNHDLLIVMGDLNAKVGNDNTNHPRAMGTQGCGTMNENGERLADFCDMNDLVIGGTLFQHKEIHKITWYSPNNRDKNQIDHLMISGKWRRSLQDIKVKRGADIGSDHYLVTAMIKLKLKRNGATAKTNTRYNVKKLQDELSRSAFTTSLKNRYQVLQELSEDAQRETGEEPEQEKHVNLMWEKIKTAYCDASKENLGYGIKGKSKDWIKGETWKAIEERRKIKQKLIETKSERIKEKRQEEYRTADKKVKNLARNDKRAYLEDLAQQAEEAAKKGEQGNVYKITKMICGKIQANTFTIPVKNKDGKILTTEPEQEERWTQHFKELLNRPPPIEVAEITEAEQDLNINVNPPNKQEILTAIKALKIGKAPGCDNLNAELFKASPETAADILYPLFIEIWKNEKVPDDWNKGIIIKIPKKGNLQDCNNWRGITLLSVPSKILCKIIIQRINQAVDNQLRKEQAGFRKDKSCIDHIFTLRNIIEQCTEWNRQLYINFVDFEKAFDSIHRESLWKILRTYGIPTKIIQVIQAFYKNFTCNVGSTKLNFEIKSGVRQGCVMSSILFNLAIDWTMRKTNEGPPRGIRWTLTSTLEDLDFADDLALLSHTHQHMQDKTQRLCRFSGQIGLKISQTKTETMILNVEKPKPIELYGTQLPNTEIFTYLGSIMRKDGGTKEDIKNRITKARNIFRTMNKVWRSTKYNIKTKLKLYNSCVVSTLLYGAECWRMTETDQANLSTFHTTSLRKILRIFWPNKISNHDLLKKCNQEDMGLMVKKRRWRWLGHVMRKDASDIIKTAMHWTPDGKRKRGRPKTTWRRTVEQEMNDMGQTWGTLEKMAKDRQRWRAFVAALHASGVMGSK